MKVLSIVGARPQFVKVAPVHQAISRRNEHSILHTGQHYDYQMSQVFFEELDIPAPDHYLGVGSGSHGEQTGKMLEAIESVLVKEQPDVAIVYGDTNSTLAGALAAAKLNVPIAHVRLVSAPIAAACRRDQSGADRPHIQCPVLPQPGVRT